MEPSRVSCRKKANFGPAKIQLKADIPSCKADLDIKKNELTSKTTLATQRDAKIKTVRLLTRVSPEHKQKLRARRMTSGFDPLSSPWN